MKKFISIGLAASLAFAGCSTDEPNVSKGTITGESAAYMNVRITDAAGTRANAGTGDNEFEVSTTEHNVTNADFYFYDEAGNFVTRANVWGGGTDGKFEEGNVEFNGNTVVALKGLADNSLPKFLVTVLNSPSSNLYGQTLDEMEKLLTDANAADGGFMSGADFIMTTSSYKRTGSEKYFVTVLTDNNFVTDPGQIADADVVTIYVERLAAKVRIEVTPNYAGATNPLVPVAGKENTYEMKMTVAGDPNEDSDASADDTTTGTDNDFHIGAETVHIHFLGWTLNGTAKKSLLIKNIDTTWDDDKFNFGFDWSEVGRHRSYWGKSFNYDNFLGTVYTYPQEGGTAAATDALNYTDGNARTAMDKAIYCAENTNTSTIVSANPAGTITSALLFAEVTDKDGNNLDLVRYSGLFYTEEQFINYVFGILNRKGQLGYYKQTVIPVEGETDTYKYDQITVGDVEINDLGGGYINLQLNLDADTELYTAEGAPIENAVAKANETLAGFAAADDIISYKGGLMYYNIPIEHFNNDAVENKVVPEAKYGIVRNHVYVLNITSLTNLGMGIYDPDEVIVPGNPIEKKELYQVGANIKILSWKVVNQNVEL